MLHTFKSSCRQNVLVWKIYSLIKSDLVQRFIFPKELVSLCVSTLIFHGTPVMDLVVMSTAGNDFHPCSRIFLTSHFHCRPECPFKLWFWGTGGPQQELGGGSAVRVRNSQKWHFPFTKVLWCIWSTETWECNRRHIIFLVEKSSGLFFQIFRNLSLKNPFLAIHIYIILNWNELPKQGKKQNKTTDIQSEIIILWPEVNPHCVICTMSFLLYSSAVAVP